MDNPVADAGETVAVAAEPEAVSQEQFQAEQSSEMVPVTALQAERRERQQLQEQNRLLHDHMSLMKANTPPEPETQDEMAGMSDDDVLTVGEARKFLGKIQNNYQSSVDELKIQQKYTDYNEVVSKYLPEVITNNPSLKNTLQNDSNKYELAYYLAKNSDSYRGSNHEANKNADAQRIMDNGQRAGSLSAVGSTSPQSQVSGIKNMSDTDFMKMANKNRGHF